MPVFSGLAPWRQRLIDERLHEIDRAPALAELAALCGLSVRQLSRSFRESAGISLGGYVNQWRIEKAKHLLANSDSIKSVAYSMGFASPSGFCYAFRKATGLSPRQYQLTACVTD